MIPKTVILGTFRVPSMIIHNNSPYVIWDGPFARTMKGEFFRDVSWNDAEMPLEGGKSYAVKSRIFHDHEFLYRSFNFKGGAYYDRKRLRKAFELFKKRKKDVLGLYAPREMPAHPSGRPRLKDHSIQLMALRA